MKPFSKTPNLAFLYLWIINLVKKKKLKLNLPKDVALINLSIEKPHNAGFSSKSLKPFSRNCDSIQKYILYINIYTNGTFNRIRKILRYDQFPLSKEKLLMKKQLD